MSFDPFDDQQNKGAEVNADESSQDSSLLGQRSESSVLFKLSDVDKVSTVASNESADKVTEGSGLIDIQHLSSMHSGGSTPEFAEDIHISPGTMSMPAITAPQTSGPPIGLIIGGAVVIVLLVVGGAVAFVITQQNNQPTERVVIKEREIIREVAPEAPDKSEAEAAAEAARLAAANQPAPEDEAGDPPKSDKKPRKGSSKSRPSSTKRDDTPTRAKPPKKGVDSILAKLDEKPSSSGGDDSPASSSVKNKLTKTDIKNTFRKGNGAINSCKKTSNPDGLSGTMWVRLTIEPSGKVSSASVDSKKSGAFDGKPLGTCVSKVVKRMRFPASREELNFSYPLKF